MFSVSFFIVFHYKYCNGWGKMGKVRAGKIAIVGFKY